MTDRARTTPAEAVALAAKAKTKVKRWGRFAVLRLSEREITAMAFVLDVFLEDDSAIAGQAWKTPEPLVETNLKTE